MATEGIVVTVGGVRETLATFDRTNKEVVAKVKGVLAKGAEWVAQGARLRAPGEKLQASIGIRVKSGGATHLIAPRATYGGMVEHGIGSYRTNFTPGTWGARAGRSSAEQNWKFSQGARSTVGALVYPSPQGLKAWAVRHGLNPFAVARNIFKRQGIGPKPFLAPAYLATFGAIQREAEIAISSVVAAANGRIPDSGGITAGTRGGV